MPLFECNNCGAIDNTAISGYWEQQLDFMRAHPEDRGLVDFRPICSECFTGTWHDKFPKDNAKEKGFIPDPHMPGFIMPKEGWKTK